MYLDYIHFNTSNVTIQQASISCKNCDFFDFNTSNVTIQLSVCHTTSFLYLISIHLMLLFNSLITLFTIFRPISIHLMLLFNCLSESVTPSYSYFNTSNVTIQLVSLPLAVVSSDFNTSNVTIQQKSLMYLLLFYIISIHLMLLFNLHLRL